MPHSISRGLFLIGALAAAAACAAERGDRSTESGQIMTRTNNHIDYVEFSAEDLGAVKKFYSEAFGWEFQDWGEEYVSFSSAGLEGGFHRRAPTGTGGPLIILYADDLEVSEARVVKAGGEITERHEFPGGKRFHFSDPAGNVLGVWKIVEGGE